jgi:S1-C subfamily serine protease
VEPEDWPDDGAYRPPLPPEDRLWRHPSELAPVTGMASPGPGGDRSGRSLLTVTLLAGAATSALIVTGLLAVTVGLGARSESGASRVTVNTLASTSLSRPTVRSGGDDLTTGLATVAVVTDGGRRTGAAVAVDTKGLLVTTASLVRDAKTIHVTLDDGTRRPATVAGLDTEAGIAVLAIAVPSMRSARLGTATGAVDDVELRDPLAGKATIQAEIDRMGQEVTVPTGETYKHLMTLEAPLWAVAEGAAVFNSDGEVIGLVTLDAAGAAHAVPIDLAVAAADGIAADGTVRAALFGVTVRVLTTDETTEFDVSGGLVIKELNTPGPAFDAGLVVGDVILSIDGRPMQSVEALVITIRAHQPGDELSVELLHEGKATTISVTLGERALDS